ncbi:MAG: hypothetical protein COB36_03535 [Alphaproteobacteria bacterium]|nr:MAG: hypothetical protein COB36_03535 [Alphaproteobacteria bacterium]
MPLRTINYALAAIVICLGLWSISMAYQTKSNQAPMPQKTKLEHKQFQSWTYACWHDDGGEGKLCALSQKITDDNGISALQAKISLIERDGEILPRLQVVVPLGTFLPLGLSVHLKPQEPFTVPFQFCNQEGCFINLDLADDVVQMLTQSQTLDISYRQESRESMKYSIGLTGFSDALYYLIARS